jgi:putative hydrolase of the HAD superfamily
MGLETSLTPTPIFDWRTIRLVAFDVDGTLYRQDRLRRRMAAELATAALARFSFAPIRILSTYRRLREKLAEAEVEHFEPVLLAQTASACGAQPEQVATIAREWMERRPLAHLRPCVYPHLPELFAAIKAGGRKIGILSDYAAQEKLRALGLSADFIVAAGDEGVGRLKPHPRGLEALMAAAGVAPQETVLIGDRPERDGEAALRAGAAALIRSSQKRAGWNTFASYDDRIFAPLLETHHSHL